MVRSLVVVAVALAFPTFAAAGPESAYYADDTAGIFWFMHISDLHTGTTDLLEQNWEPENTFFALNEGVQVIGPTFVVATGDLVDGSALDIPTWGQDQAEWDQYRRMYAAAGMTADFYFDVIGNHDEYNDGPSFYLDNSLQGQATDALHFSWIVSTPLGDYFFYGFNATGDHMPRFDAGDGTIIDSEFTALQQALAANASAELLFVFAHQGPNQPQNSDRVVDELATAGAFYVHGHIHEYKEYLEGNGAFVVNEVDSLGKANRDNLAVGVIDHNAFIYRATSTENPWPFVVVTAPVASHLRDGELNPWAYDPCKDRVNPFRALVFAPTTPTSVTVQAGWLDPVDMTPDAAEPRLWSARVDTAALEAGAQNVVVEATVEGDTASDLIVVNFTEGPCEPLPQSDAGTPPGDGAAPPDDAGAAGDDAGMAGDGGMPPDAARPDGAGGQVGSGCSCRAGVRAAGGPAALLALAALLAPWRRRRRRHDV